MDRDRAERGCAGCFAGRPDGVALAGIRRAARSLWPAERLWADGATGTPGLDGAAGSVRPAAGSAGPVRPAAGSAGPVRPARHARPALPGWLRAAGTDGRPAADRPGHVLLLAV